MFGKDSYSILLLLVLSSLLGLSTERKTSLYDSSKSNTLLLNRDNFDKQITKHRSTLVSIIHFYKYDDDGSQDLSTEFEKLASDWQGAFRIATVDCYEQYELCEKEKINKFPTVRIYPLLPVPPFDYEGDMSAKGWTGAASRFVHSHVLELNSSNIHKFLNENPSVPKSVLFTDKPGVPLIFKALSVALDKKIFLGIVRSDQEDIFREYGVKNTPQIVIFKPSEKRPSPYIGELKYGKIFDFLNIYTETFVPGGEKLDFEKPWNRESFPELQAKSGTDICFDHEGYLCGILLTKESPGPAQVAVFEGIMRDGRENKFKYMWLNVDTQEGFAKAIEVQDYPKLILLSHGKRKKYVIHEGEISKNSIENTLELISSGDARFKHIGDELPPLN